MASNELQLLTRKVEKVEGDLDIALSAIERLNLIVADSQPQHLGRPKFGHKYGVIATHSD